MHFLCKCCCHIHLNKTCQNKKKMFTINLSIIKIAPLINLQRTFHQTSSYKIYLIESLKPKITKQILKSKNQNDPY